MKLSILSSKRIWVIGILLTAVVWGCSDSISYNESNTNESVTARSGSENAGIPLLQQSLFTIVDKEQLSSQQRNMLSTIWERPTTSEVHIATLASAPSAILEKGSSIVINTSPGRQFVAEADTVTYRGPSDLSWAGPMRNGVGWTQLVLSERGITGWLRQNSLLFKFESLGGGYQAIIRLDPSKAIPEHPAEYTSGALTDTTGRRTKSSIIPDGESSFVTKSETNSGSADIGVLVVYTQAAENAANNIEDLIDTGIDEANQSYSNSNIYASVYEAHTAQVNYDESGRSYTQHVDALKSTSDGVMDNVHSLRNQYLADVVILIVDDDEYCGRASLPILASTTTAFAAVHHACVTGPVYYSLAHEIGHLQGARHNRAVDSNNEPFQYGHGYVDPNDQWRTIMAYDNACNGCQRIQYWSNPYVDHPTSGQAMGTVDYENNARVLNETRYDLRDFKTLPAPQNFTHDNPYSYGDNPEFSWSDVPEANEYNVYRCITDDSNYAPSCFQEVYGSITSNGSGWEWMDAQVTIDQYGAPCDKKAIYRVTSQNITGEATAPSEPQVCIDMGY